MSVTVLLASSNQGKLAEFLAMSDSVILPRSPIRLALLGNFADGPAFEESAPTFAENAAGKAMHYSRFTEDAVLADDSGLVVPALGGAPGVRSARYAGPNATSEQRNAKLLYEMRDLAAENRRAYFVCVLAIAIKGAPTAIISARADGEILSGPRGNAGFGYDPIFYLRELDKTFAELTGDEKNALSHRGKAFRRLLSVITGL
ncbi:MAG: RdgB/HAM1 family non-canonical purine NTP pyrophosphatase [Candidatus Acidiferrum sp.]|jgi:XTP/dITP diphosphohydrolase